jgi:hypothetical protein
MGGVRHAAFICGEELVVRHDVGVCNKVVVRHDIAFCKNVPRRQQAFGSHASSAGLQASAARHAAIIKHVPSICHPSTTCHCACTCHCVSTRHCCHCAAARHCAASRHRAPAAEICSHKTTSMSSHQTNSGHGLCSIISILAIDLCELHLPSTLPQRALHRGFIFLILRGALLGCQ